MDFLVATLPWFVSAGTIVIIGHCICSLNRMDEHTSPWVFGATTIVAIGAFWELCTVVTGSAVTGAEALLVAGMVASIAANRRADTPCPCVLSPRLKTSKKEPPHAVV